MAMTQTGLVILGGIATLASMGMFRGFRDDGTEIVVHVAATAAWFFLGVSALDVIVRDSYAATASEPMYPVAYLGLAFGLGSFMLTLWRIVKALGDEAGATKSDGVMMNDRR